MSSLDQPSAKVCQACGAKLPAASLSPVCRGCTAQQRGGTPAGSPSLSGHRGSVSGTIPAFGAPSREVAVSPRSSSTTHLPAVPNGAGPSGLTEAGTAGSSSDSRGGSGGPPTTTRLRALGRGGAKPEAPEGYEILDELGRGAMGVVYKARDVRINRAVALKVLLSGGHSSPQDMERFQREAQAVAAISHPNIVALYEVGEQAGLAYFAMEFCAGGQLSARVAGRPMMPKRAAGIVEAIARAAAAAHAGGILHRDIKPANILLTAEGVPKLADFGLAKRIATDDRDGSFPLPRGGLTITGAALGTPSYMPPEQAEGRPITPAADVYALGAVLYELLTGRPPFVGESEAHTVWMVLSAEPLAVRQLAPRVPQDLETLCLRCLDKDPSRRLASATELADELRRFIEDRPIKARAAGAIELTVRWVRRKPLAATAVGLLVLALTAVSVALVGVASERQRVEIARQQAEAAVAALETQKAQAEKARTQALTAQAQAETARAESEAARTESETARAQAEMARTAAEDQRAQTAKALDEARANFELARKAVRECLDLAQSHEIFQKSHVQEARALLLSVALPYHKRFTENSDQIDDWAAFAAANYQAANALKDQLQHTAAAEAYQRCIEGYERVLEKQPTPANRLSLARVFIDYGSVLLNLRQYPQAEAAFARGETLYRELCRQDPDNTDYQAGLGGILNNRGQLHSALKRHEQALEDYRAAYEIFNAALVRRPNSLVLKGNASTALSNIGEQLLVLGQHQQGYQKLAQGVALAEELVEGLPGRAQHHTEYVRQNEVWAKWLSKHQRWDEALEVYFKARKRLTVSVRQFASHNILRHDLMAIINNEANILLRLKRPAEAEPLLATAAEMANELHLEKPDNIHTAASMAQVYANWGLSLLDSNRAAQARPKFSHAVAIMDRVLRQAPKVAEYQAMARTFAQQLALCERALGGS